MYNRDSLLLGSSKAMSIISSNHGNYITQNSNIKTTNPLRGAMVSNLCHHVDHGFNTDVYLQGSFPILKKKKKKKSKWRSSYYYYYFLATLSIRT